MGDDSWKKQSKYMSLEIAKQLKSRIVEHLIDHNEIDQIFISFHGGEPLSVGAERLQNYCDIFKEICNEVPVRLSFSTQTNGVFLDEKMINTLKKNRVFVGVSVDGPKEYNDLHRVDHKGKSTFIDTQNGINKINVLAQEYFNSVFAVIDLRIPPLEVFDYFGAIGVENCDFLLPHYNWDLLPPRYGKGSTAYGEWLYEIWSAWIQGRNKHMNIRFFESIVRNFLGSESLYEAMTDAPASLITINSDGDYEGVDTLKSTGNSSQVLGYNILSHSLNEVLEHQAVQQRQIGIKALSDKCLTCEHLKRCYGGYYPHRFKKSNGFKNESVYCDDLFYLISRMRDDLVKYKKLPNNA
jgi:uncharacterized protein